ncbi:MAG: tetratricopeptide repeat protein [Saccharospirillaceae bacterium]|nr:tetratricopeptide repeat protein [Saccharospirillaceae bacterium]MCD8532092.1 tetratricopeptide repeat protein [Saccharospirillaceae bacterium]
MMRFITAIKLLSLLVFLLPAACSYQRTNDVVKGYGNSGWVSETEAVSEQVIEKPEIAEQAKKQHGLMHIHRYGDGYDVLLTLDAGDSDVKFVMDLPGKPLKTEETVAPDIAEDTTDYPDDDNAEKLHENINAHAQQQEKTKNQQVENTTKHILNAQSLFYKKQYWQALDETNAALDNLPDSAQAHALKGSIYYKMGLIPEARSSWEQALKLDPSLEQVKSSLDRLKQ